MEPELPVWTSDDLRKLMRAIKKHIPKSHQNSEYTYTQKRINWDMVAFHPYSSEVCERKWEEISEELQKVRTLSELIDDAELRLSWKNKNQKEQQPCSLKTASISQNLLLNSGGMTSTPGNMPVKPPGNGYLLFIKDQMSCMQHDIMPKDKVVTAAQLWKNLTQSQKEEHNIRCKELKQDYQVKIRKHLVDCPKPSRSMVNPVLFPGEPKKPSHLGNVVFCKEQMALMKNKMLDTRKRMAMISPKWKKLSDTERCYYKRKAEEKLDAYAVELRNWFKTLTAKEQAHYKHIKPGNIKHLGHKVDQEKSREAQKDEAKQCRPSDSEDEDIEDSNSDDNQVADLSLIEEEEYQDNKYWTHQMEMTNNDGIITSDIYMDSEGSAMCPTSSTLTVL